MYEFYKYMYGLKTKNNKKLNKLARIKMKTEKSTLNRYYKYLIFYLNINLDIM